MFRRSVLTLGIMACTGCIASPEPSDRLLSTPNIFVAFDWTGSGYELTFEYGTTLTTQNTESLSVHHHGERDGETYWLSQNTDAHDEFPLEPGASITVETQKDAELSVVWSTVDRSVRVDGLRADETTNSSTKTTEEQ